MQKTSAFAGTEPVDAEKERQQAAVHAIEQWNLGQYFFNMLRYASAKQLPWPRLDFTLNGQLLFRLEIDEIDVAEENLPQKNDTSLELTLKYFGLQTNFIKAKSIIDPEYSALCSFNTLPDDDDDDENKEADGECCGGADFPPCELDRRFDMVLEDKDAASGLCYATSFTSIDSKTLDQIFALVGRWFKSLERRGAEQQSPFCDWPLWTVERLFYSATHDALSVAREVKELPATVGDNQDGQQAIVVAETHEDEATQEFERELRCLDDEAAAQKNANDECVSSCQLHADVWQYNDKHQIMAVGRQYENLGAFSNFNDAKHVPFRGAPDDLQKKLYIGEFYAKMLPIVCLALAGSRCRHNNE